METKVLLVLIDDTIQSDLIYSKEEAEEIAANLVNKYNKQAIVVETVFTFNPQEINLVVDSYEAALKYLGHEDNNMVIWTGSYPEAMISMYKLLTIAEAWNKADNFIPDFDNSSQRKWYPWFYKPNKSVGFMFAYPYNAPSNATAALGARLCFKTEERAEQFGTQFIDLWNDFLLFK